MASKSLWVSETPPPVTYRVKGKIEGNKGERNEELEENDLKAVKDYEDGEENKAERDVAQGKRTCLPFREF